MTTDAWFESNLTPCGAHTFTRNSEIVPRADVLRGHFAYTAGAHSRNRAARPEPQIIQHLSSFPRSPVRWHCPRTGQTQSLAVRYEQHADRLLAQGDDFSFDLTAPAKLQPVEIIKPWGREIWYTGSETRGESRVIGHHGSLPLAAYAALAPEAVTGNLPLVLLKILVSEPQPRKGELYLEVHREKAEAYLVTHIDRNAWPNGVARLRYGISARTRGQYADEKSFRQALTETALALEADPENPDKRQRLQSFIATVPIHEGSRVRIEPGIPHGLPHGVRVVEFQTPIYERLILAASQTVVTQSGWDCVAAVEALRTEPPPAIVTGTETRNGLQSLACFQTFGTQTLNLNARLPELDLPDTRGAAVVLCSQGTVTLGTLTLTAEDAAIVPAVALTNPLSLRKLTPEATCVIAGADY